MKAESTLTPARPEIVMALPWLATSLVVVNFTPSPVYVRIGAPDFASATNADILVPAAQSVNVPVHQTTFSFRLGNVALIPASAVAVSGLFSTVRIMLLDDNEKTPTFGSVSFLALSLSELTAGVVAFAAPVTVGPFDIGAWGGALFTIFPSAVSGQGIATVQTSADQVTWDTLGAWAFWPGVPAVLTVPRVARYFRVLLTATGIVGEPVIAGRYHVRATIEELQSVSYNPSSTTITLAYNIANLSETSRTLCTVGLEAISVQVNPTNTGSGRMQLITERAETPITAFNLAFQREQFHSVLQTMYVSIGNLGPFTRLRLLNTGNTGAITGVLGFAIQDTAETTSVLRQILAALGDVGAPVNVNQDIYHSLETSRASLASIDAQTTGQSGQLAAIQTAVQATAVSTAGIDIDTNNLSGMAASLVGIDTDTNQLPGIQASLTSIDTKSNNLANIQTNATAINTATAAAAASLGAGNLTTILNSTNTRLGAGDLTTILNSLNTRLGAGDITVALAAIQSALQGSVQVASFAYGPAAAGAWANTGTALPANSRIVGILVSATLGAPAGGMQAGVGVGTGGGFAAAVFQGYFPVIVAGGVILTIPFVNITAPGSGRGYNVGGNTTIYVFPGAAGVLWLINVYYN